MISLQLLSRISCETALNFDWFVLKFQSVPIRITATFKHWQAPDLSTLRTHAKNHGGEVVTWTEFEQRARPRLLTKIWNELC